MAVYREGYKALELIQKRSKQIYDDACDFGALTRKGDELWNAAKQLIDWYGDKNRKQEDYSTGATITCDFTLIDEWAVSDERKTEEEATEKYRLTYVHCKNGIKTKEGKYDGYFYIERYGKDINPTNFGRLQTVFSIN